MVNYYEISLEELEDSEIVQLLQAQIAGLQQDYQQEISRFMSDQDGSAE